MSSLRKRPRLRALLDPGYPYKTETEFKKAVMDVAAGRGVVLNRRQAGTMFGKRIVFLGRKGWSDLDGFLPSGAYIAIETKTPRGMLSDEQWAFIQQVNATRLGVAFWCASIIHACEGIDHALSGHRLVHIDRKVSGEWAWTRG